MLFLFCVRSYGATVPTTSYGAYTNVTPPHLIQSPRMSYSTQSYSPAMIHQRSPAYAVMFPFLREVDGARTLTGTAIGSFGAP
jgi:hypothetical protein